jgi:hypothetical protein
LSASWGQFFINSHIVWNARLNGTLKQLMAGDVLAARDFSNLPQSVVIGILSLPDLKDRYSRHALFPVYAFVSPAALVDRIDSPSSRDGHYLHTFF